LLPLWHRENVADCFVRACVRAIIIRFLICRLVGR
jgi:hypothetical protein